MSNGSKSAAVYGRTSSKANFSGHSTPRQFEAGTKAARSDKKKVVIKVAEQCSGVVDISKRKGLTELIEKCVEKKVE